MRQGEILGLRWSDIDLERGTVAVKATLTRSAAGKLARSDPKAGKSRVIDLPNMTIDALKASKGLANPDESDWAFHDGIGKPLSKDYVIHSIFHKLCKSAGVPRKRFHDLRHTHVTQLLTQGVHPKVVQERLGHSSIRITMDLYSHVMPTIQREAAAKIDGIYQSAKVLGVEPGVRDILPEQTAA